MCIAWMAVPECIVMVFKNLPTFAFLSLPCFLLSLFVEFAFGYVLSRHVH